ncbi:MAG: histidine phosphatase family protein [Gammaproteobacteria bacterium]|nr:MAG: histidine phosphatase family protein [Gammaproteobacteria bacterium]
MKEKTLLLMRHAKSDWHSDAERDFDRPLNKRGRRDAPRMGRWLLDNGLVPERVLASPARRARETLEAMLKEWPREPELVWEEDIYGGGSRTLLELINATPDRVSILLLLGHNPDLEDLLLMLAERPPGRGVKKLLPTAAIARLHFQGSWRSLAPEGAVLEEIVRPKDLPSE